MYEQAVAEFQHPSVRMRADARGYLGHVLAKTGRQSEALVLLQDLDEPSKREFISPYGHAVLYAGLNDKDNALAYLNRSRVGKQNEF